ncbi:50S ribosomal protein L11 methyltransferase [Chthonobacter rhizosphaerae]|uniref:50S ribosomal protein L11 methyltransferase n=1 Tax=Chthonobacter rhizosphaerae TaxID=2735553 RepID=UPI0015EF6F8C|nr:50S ribosomal protein L11 methyltransferase [Chthonobacter rhizosphaerae]
MRQYQVQIRADREESERIARLLDAALEDEGAPVSWFEVPDGWAVDAWIFGDDAETVRTRVLDILGADGFGAPVTVFETPDEDWVKLSLEGLKPVVAGRFVVHGAHDRDKLPAGLIGLEIEAAQAFGTGHHPTTWGCLVALSRLLPAYRFPRALDLGTGTGVLAIAVAKMTRRRVIASDIDPISVVTAADNARLNGVPSLVTAVTAAGLDHAALRGTFDLVVANILADPLKALAPKVFAHTSPRAVVVLSGILSTQAPSVLATYRSAGFTRLFTVPKEGWTTLVLERRG